MSDSTGRKLPNARVRRVMLAIQEVMGRSGLTTVVRQAGLPRYAAELPPSNTQTVMTAAEYAALMQAIENYYGRGARGTLTRIGYAAFNLLLKSQPLSARFYKLLFLVLPPQSRQLTALRVLARDMAAPAGQVTAHRDDRRVVLVDHEGDAAFSRQRDSEVCWVTLGQIQAALKWSTGSDYDVVEESCKAKGAPACRFEIGEALS